MRYLTKTTVGALAGLSLLFPVTGVNCQVSNGGVAQTPSASVAAPAYNSPNVAETPPKELPVVYA